MLRDATHAGGVVLQASENGCGTSLIFLQLRSQRREARHLCVDTPLEESDRMRCGVDLDEALAMLHSSDWASFAVLVFKVTLSTTASWAVLQCQGTRLGAQVR